MQGTERDTEDTENGTEDTEKKRDNGKRHGRNQAKSLDIRRSPTENGRPFRGMSLDRVGGL